MSHRNSLTGWTARVLLCLALAGLLVVPAVQAAPVQSTVPPGDRDDNLFTEGFETAWPPAGWATIQTGSPTWGRSNYDHHTGTYSAAVFWSSSPQNEWLVLPAIDLSGAINPKLEWYERALNWATGGHHMIMASTTSQTDMGSFSVIADQTPGNHSITDFSGEPATVNLVSLAGQPTVYLAFRYTGTAATNDSWFIDDVRIYTPSGHDVGAVSVSPGGGNLDGGTPVTPQVTVENFGQSDESFDVTLDISDSGGVVYSQTMSVTALGPGLQEVLNFPNFTPDPGEYYDLSGSTMLAGDGDAGNDTALSDFTTYFDQHVPIAFFFTNSGCPPCYIPNLLVDDYMPDQGNNVSMLRIHVWWPYGGDIMYLANPAQSQALVSAFGVNAVPDFYLDATWAVGYDGPAMIAAMDEGKTWKSPMHMDLAWDDSIDQLTVNEVVTGAIRPGANYQLFWVITEDNIVHAGGNGETVHHQAFRHQWPAIVSGDNVLSTPGTHSYSVTAPLDGSWVYDNLRATVWIRDMNSGDVVQSATAFLTEIGDLTGVETPTAPAFGLAANHPNPFNPKTSIDFALNAAGPMSLRIYDSAGRLVRTLRTGVMDAGPHSITWNGVDDAGQPVASGVYLARLESAGQSDSRKLLLAK